MRNRLLLAMKGKPCTRCSAVQPIQRSRPAHCQAAAPKSRQARAAPARLPPATPLGMPHNQLTNLGDIEAADSATLNRFGVLHAPRLPEEVVGVPYNL